MYEIPPSVNRYLRTSSKSRIHYPRACCNNQKDSTNSENAKTFFYTSSNDAKNLKTYEEKDSHSPELEKKYSTYCTSRKRKFEEPEKDLGSNIKRRLPDVSYIHEAVALIQTGNHPCHNAQYLDKPAVTQDSMINNHQSLPQDSLKDSQKLLTLIKKLPEIKPKLNRESNNITCKSKLCVARKNPWGSESYSDLISNAIVSFPNNKATLQQIYEWIVSNIPYFADKADYPSSKGWKNAIRHTLSIRKRFRRIVNDSSPHASLWTLSKHKVYLNGINYS